MNHFFWNTPVLILAMVPFLSLESCHAVPNTSGPITTSRTQSANSPISAPPPPSSGITESRLALTTASPADQTLLKKSWEAYRQQFIQKDGRVIDREASDRSTSEGQAYALLRAVMMGDRDTFDRSLQWAENNLQRTRDGNQIDSLWAWHWGKNDGGDWTILDPNFASDADIDAVTALILASRRWQHRPYLDLALIKLRDLWNLSTVADARMGSQQRRYLLPGPAEAFQKQSIVQLNPSYFAPAAFRLFAQVDSTHNWQSLIESSYQVLEQSSALSKVGLPGDWLLVDLTTGEVKPLTTPNPGTSEYGFDAYRVWWRVATDAEWFNEPRARSFLQKHLKPIQKMWQSSAKIPARIDLQGNPAVTYEATSQYGMLYNGFRLINPQLAAQIRRQKVDPRYQNGFWDGNTAYYTQNLVWFGIAPSAPLAPWLKP